MDAKSLSYLNALRNGPLTPEEFHRVLNIPSHEQQKANEYFLDLERAGYACRKMLPISDSSNAWKYCLTIVGQNALLDEESNKSQEKRAAFDHRIFLATLIVAILTLAAAILVPILLQQK